MQTERPVYEEIEEILRGVELPRVALVEQTSGTPPELGDIRGAVREALREVELPAGSVAVGGGSRGGARGAPPERGDIRGAVREALREVELPAGSVAVGVGSRGVARIDEVTAALVEALKEAGGGPAAGGAGGGRAGRAPAGWPAPTGGRRPGWRG